MGQPLHIVSWLLVSVVEYASTLTQYCPIPPVSRSATVSIGAIVGGIVGAILVVLLVILLIIFLVVFLR